MRNVLNDVKTVFEGCADMIGCDIVTMKCEIGDEPVLTRDEVWQWVADSDARCSDSRADREQVENVQECVSACSRSEMAALLDAARVPSQWVW